MAVYRVQDTSLTAVADAIRAKAGTSGALTFPDGFVDAVGGIQAGGGGAATGTIVPAQDNESGFIFNHALNKVPTAFVIYRESDATAGSSTASGFVCGYFSQEAGRIIRNTASGASTSLNTFTSNNYVLGSELLQCTDVDVIWKISFAVTAFKAGYVYRWFAW